MSISSERKKEKLRANAGMTKPAPDTGSLNSEDFKSFLQKMATENQYSAAQMRTENAILLERSKSTGAAELDIISDTLKDIFDDLTSTDANTTTGTMSKKRLDLLESKINQQGFLDEESLSVAQEQLKIVQRQAKYETETRLSKKGYLMDAFKNQLPSITGIITGLLGNNIGAMFVGGMVQDVMDSRRKEKEKLIQQEENFYKNKARLEEEIANRSEQVNSERANILEQDDTVLQLPAPEVIPLTPLISHEGGLGDIKEGILAIEQHTLDLAMASMQTTEEKQDSLNLEKKAIKNDEKDTSLLTDIETNTSYFHDFVQAIKKLLMRLIDSFLIGAVIGTVIGSIVIQFEVLLKGLTTIAIKMLKLSGIWAKASKIFTAITKLKFVENLSKVFKYLSEVGVTLSRLGSINRYLKFLTDSSFIQKIIKYFRIFQTFLSPIAGLARGIMVGMSKLALPFTIIMSLIDFVQGFSQTQGSLLEKIIGGIEKAFIDFFEMPLRFISWVIEKVAGLFGADLDGKIYPKVEEFLHKIFNIFGTIGFILADFWKDIVAVKNSFTEWISTHNPFTMIKDGVLYVVNLFARKLGELIIFLANNDPISLLMSAIETIFNKISNWISEKFDIDMPTIDMSEMKTKILSQLTDWIPFDKAREWFKEKLGLRGGDVGKTTDPIISDVPAPEVIAQEEQGFLSRMAEEVKQAFTSKENTPGDIKDSITPTVATATDIINKGQERIQDEQASMNSAAIIATTNNRTTTNVNANKTVQVAPQPRNADFSVDFAALGV